MFYMAFNDSCSAYQVARQEREADAILNTYEENAEENEEAPHYPEYDPNDIWDMQDIIEDN